ncbi:MAG: hypothetical protein COV59_00295 [Candidatus Magasanikbacteria bacterium CG11_big_fil_rev_8_21_14_0_20_39_34]|uniref:DUF5667 domain-containing protein n=1 Tax=Candidatus Magasanikbacteria bacterium CG11_big_fil_rev_8_21_14_0_20_39_34 TaxID=1974653 RepID=A0A2H0N6N2_9BACT|nr:MAG: hypothetical protein COV59_00295 [Candidatus Magasanikbacteria bacterium CG11_big_fil_rev_8_21_14_0_20_39_34]
MKKFIQNAKKIRLSPKDKQNFRLVLENQIAENRSVSVRKTFSFRQTLHRGADLFNITFNLKKYMFVNLFLALIVVLGGGTAFAAENSLPGDALYPVKVHVNENVRSLAAVGLENQTEWDIERGERRLEEAAQLAKRGELSDKVKSQLSEQVEKGLDKAEKSIARLQEKGNPQAAVAISNTLQAKLQAGAALLINLGLSQDDAATSTREALDLLAHVRNLTDQATEVSENAESEAVVEANTKPEVSVRNRKDLAERKFEKVLKLLEENKEDMDADVYLKAETQLSNIQETLTNANIKLEAQQYREAFSLYGSVNNMLERLQAYVKIHLRSHLGIHIPDLPFKLRPDRGDDDDNTSTSTTSTLHTTREHDEDEDEDDDHEVSTTTQLRIRVQEKSDERRNDDDNEGGRLKIRVKEKNDNEKFEIQVRGEL